MKRIELTKKLAGIVELKKQVEELRTGETNKFVALGFLSQEEFDEWQRVSQVSYQEYHVGHAAEEAIRYEIPMNQYPKEYQKLVRRMDELKPDVDLSKEVWEILSGMTPRKPNRYSNGTCLGEQLNVADRAQQLFTFLMTTTTEEEQELDELKASQERKTREGTVVRRINQEAWSKTDALQKAAGAKAREEYHQAHLVEINRKEELDQLIETRREMKLLVVGKAINDLLQSVLTELAGNPETADMVAAAGFVKEIKVCPKCHRDHLRVGKLDPNKPGKVFTSCPHCEYVEEIALPAPKFIVENYADIEKRMAGLQ